MYIHHCRSNHLCDSVVHAFHFHFYTPPPRHGHSNPHLTPDKRKKHHAGLPKHLHALGQGEGELPGRGGGELEPDGEEGDGEEVVEEDEGFADDAGEEADGAVDAGAAALEVAEAAELEGAEGGV